jgi:hypothetical protein
MDDFNSLSNRLLGRCPSAGIILAQQFVNDAWHDLQARREWSWRRGSGTIAPPDLVALGQASTNVSSGQPLLVTGTGTNWDPTMVGRQIRIGGLLYPFYTITAVLSATQLMLDKPWEGKDVTGLSYGIQKIYYEVPSDFAYFYTVVSVKDGYRLWLNVTRAEIDMWDPQRTNFGQTYAVAFFDYTALTRGSISPAIPINQNNGNIASTTTAGYSYPVAATYLVQISTGGATGQAQFQWLRIGNLGGLSFPMTTESQPIDLSDGVQVFFPADVTWNAGEMWVINGTPGGTSGVPRYEFWPGPTFSLYLYPFVYIKKETDLSVQSPQLPPFIANRGEVLLEMALEKCSEFPGTDADHRNIYYDLAHARYHRAKWTDLLIDLERNDEEIGMSNLDYQIFPMYPSPWLDAQWQQRHSPFLNG